MKREIITIDEYGRQVEYADRYGKRMDDGIGNSRIIRHDCRNDTCGYQSHSQRKRPARLRGLHVYPSGQRQSGGRI